MPKIVYLDDDRIQHLLMKKIIKIQLPEWTSENFSQPEELCDWLATNETDIILSDLNLENSSAWDWVDKFQKISAAQIVFLTAHASPEDFQKQEQFMNVKFIFEKPLSGENWEEIKGMISQ
ncbi:response regulator [Algoriphagus mannitolivorans]|uniref:response regulator n=1 Tax=Algoriphagus mannitolivorans TaxID=226504 RepID=UPI00041D5A92|nr:response regulator [Algoriphagus mannitolivorans]